MNKNINKKVLAIAALIVALSMLVVIYVLLRPVKQTQTQEQSAATTQTQEQSVATTQADNSTQPKDQISYIATSGSSALAQLESQNDTVVVVESDLGSYVDSINGLKGGADGKYWSFYVDGEMASVGAGQFMPKGGEKIEWKFQKL